MQNPIDDPPGSSTTAYEISFPLNHYLALFMRYFARRFRFFQRTDFRTRSGDSWVAPKANYFFQGRFFCEAVDYGTVGFR
jgi:hypothetical protein